MGNQNQESGDSFVPKGAIAFFVSLTVFFAAIWFGFYALLLLRQNG